MKIPAPEDRNCESCSNRLPLNLFQLNSYTCRYCQNGIKIPSRLINKETTTAIEKVTSRLDDIQKDLNIPSEVNNIITKANPELVDKNEIIQEKEFSIDITNGKEDEIIDSI